MNIPGRLSLVGIAVVVAAVNANVARAQTSATMQGVEATVARARTMLDRGEGAAARVLIDSLVDAQPPSSTELAESLHWRAVMSESVADAERDWKRLLLEAPLADRASDALLRLTELELLRGHAAIAKQHAERLLRDHSSSTNRGAAMLLITRALFAENDVAGACTSLGTLRQSLTANGSEVQLQADELQSRCKSVAAMPPVTTKTVVDDRKTADKNVPDKNTVAGKSATEKTTTKPETTKPASTDSIPQTVTGRYSVQLAAYNKLADAEALVKQLDGIGISARVDGTVQPFRVRTGRYATRADAVRALAQYTKRGMQGFVAEITP